MVNGSVFHRVSDGSHMVNVSVLHRVSDGSYMVNGSVFHRVKQETVKLLCPFLVLK